MGQVTADLDVLHACLECDAEAGTLTWKRRAIDTFAEGPRQQAAWKSWNTKYAGTPFGSVDRNGYRRGRIARMGVLAAHRIIWAMHHNHWPEDFELDHINGDRADNRIANLREVASDENMRNKAVYSSNRSGHHGVGYCKRERKWYARISVEGVKRSLGYHDSKSKAVAARRAAEKRHDFHPNHGRETTQ